MPHITFAAAALAILAFAAASPAFAQADDVIVDGRIITGENPARAAAGFDQGFTGGVFVASGSDSAKGQGGGKSSAYGQSFQGGVRVAVGDVNGDGAAAAGSRHSGGVNVLMGDGSVKFNQPSGAGSNGGLGDGSVRGLSSGVGGGSFNAPKTGALGSLNGVGSIGQLATPAGAPPAQASNNLKQLGLAAHNYDSSRSGGDVNGDGVGDIITGAGPGGGAHVKSGPGGGPTVKVFDAGRAAAAKPAGAPSMKAAGDNARAVGVGGAVATFTLDKNGKSTK